MQTAAGPTLSEAVDWLKLQILKNGPGDYFCMAMTHPIANLRVVPELLQQLGDIGHWNRADRTLYLWDGRMRIHVTAMTAPVDVLQGMEWKAIIWHAAGPSRRADSSTWALFHDRMQRAPTFVCESELV